MSPLLIRWLKLVLVEMLMPKYIVLSDQWSNLHFCLNTQSQIILRSKVLCHHFYLSKVNNTCPNWPGVLSRLHSSMHLRHGTSLLSTPLPFWTCIITLGK